jgi:hypothetical protein
MSTVTLAQIGTFFGNEVKTLITQLNSKANTSDIVNIPRFFEADSDASMLQLLGLNVGDFCVRTDILNIFKLTTTPASILNNWRLIVGSGASSVEAARAITAETALITALQTTNTALSVFQSGGASAVGINSSLTTTTKSSIVNAINEVNAKSSSALGGAVVYQGQWDASVNNPDLASTSSNPRRTKGYNFKVSVSGTTNLDGISQWNAGDQAIYNGTTWDKFDGLSNEVTSVNGRTGNVTTSLSDIINIPTPTVNNTYLKWNGTSFVWATAAVVEYTSFSALAAATKSEGQIFIIVSNTGGASFNVTTGYDGTDLSGTGYFDSYTTLSSNANSNLPKGFYLVIDTNLIYSWNGTTLSVYSNVTTVRNTSIAGTVTLTSGPTGSIIRTIIAGGGVGTTITSLTLTLPVSPVDGSIIELLFVPTISSLLLSSNILSGIISGGSIIAGSGGKWVYSSADSIWLSLS